MTMRSIPSVVQAQSDPERVRRVAASAQPDRWLTLPMLVLTVAFLPVLLIPEVDRHLSPGTRAAFVVADWGIRAAFAIEYLARLAVAPSRWLYVKTHPH